MTSETLPERQIRVWVQGEGIYSLHREPLLIRKASTWSKSRKPNKRRDRVIRALLFVLDPHCRYCRKRITSYDRATVDHVQPEGNGGKSRRRNLVLCCPACNRHKSNREIHEWRRVLETMLESVKQIQAGHV